jgi:hypothetical protein
MKTRQTKRSLRVNSNCYCAHCYVRVGIGERHLIKDGKPYHYTCYVKVNDTQPSPREERPA